MNEDKVRKREGGIKEKVQSLVCANTRPKAGGVPKIVLVQWTSKGASTNVKAVGFFVKNPTRALSLCLLCPQSVRDANFATYPGHSAKMCRRV